VIFAGGGANELVAGTHSYSTTGIVARGRIYVGADNKVYAFFLRPWIPRATVRADRARHQPRISKISFANGAEVSLYFTAA
jgi:hypothetical protein